MAFAKSLQFLFSDPVPLGLKEKIVAAAACLGAIFVTGEFCRLLGHAASEPLLIASMGASAVILFAIPNSPLAQPWPLVGGQLLSAGIGVTCVKLFPDAVHAAALATGLSVLFMLLLRCLHPPGAATALAPVLGSEALRNLGFDFVLFPVGVNVLIMLAAAIMINRVLLRRSYPLFKSSGASSAREGISGAYNEAYILKALGSFDHFIDVSSEELSRLFSATEKLAFIRYRGDIRCAEIMRKEVISVDYATEVEDAWALMQQHKLKALPVLSRSRHVIGIITPQDFFKFVDLRSYRQFAGKFRAFLHRTDAVSADKPEAAGHIMTRHVVTLEENAHIADLIPLMCSHGHRHIPIVDAQQRLAGMVYESDLVAALYHRSVSNVLSEA